MAKDGSKPKPLVIDSKQHNALSQLDSLLAQIYKHAAGNGAAWHLEYGKDGNERLLALSLTPAAGEMKRAAGQQDRRPEVFPERAGQILQNLTEQIKC